MCPGECHQCPQSGIWGHGSWFGLLVPKGGFQQEGNHGPVNSVGSVSVQSSFSGLWLGKGKRSLHLNADTGFSPGTRESFSIKMLMKEQTATPNLGLCSPPPPPPLLTSSQGRGLDRPGSFPGHSIHKSQALAPGGCSGDLWPWQAPFAGTRRLFTGEVAGDESFGVRSQLGDLGELSEPL